MSALRELLERALCPYPNKLADNHARLCVGLSHTRHEDKVNDFLFRVPPAIAARLEAALAPDALSADAFARQFMRIRGAHGPYAAVEDGNEPCDWCRLAGDQAAEAARRLLGIDGGQ